MTDKGQDEEEPSWGQRAYKFAFGGEVRRLIATAVIAGVVVLVIGVVLFGRGEGGSTSAAEPSAPGEAPPSANEDPKNRGDEIQGRDFWVREPEIYRPVPEAFDTDVVNLNIVESDVSAFLPGELADSVAQFDFYRSDYTLFIVGRVLETAIHPSSFGLEREVVVVDDDGLTAAVIGAPSDAVDTCCFKPGDVVYALVRVAALGDARIAGTKVRRVIYVVVTRDYSASIVTLSFPVHPRSEISKEITSRAVMVRAS